MNDQNYLLKLDIASRTSTANFLCKKHFCIRNLHFNYIIYYSKYITISVDNKFGNLQTFNLSTY